MLQFNKIGGGIAALAADAVQCLEALPSGTLAVVAGHAVAIAHDIADVISAVESAFTSAAPNSVGAASAAVPESTVQGADKK